MFTTSTIILGFAIAFANAQAGGLGYGPILEAMLPSWLMTFSSAVSASEFDVTDNVPKVKLYSCPPPTSACQATILQTANNPVLNSLYTRAQTMLTFVH